MLSRCGKQTRWWKLRLVLTWSIPKIQDISRYICHICHIRLVKNTLILITKIEDASAVGVDLETTGLTGQKSVHKPALFFGKPMGRVGQIDPATCGPPTTTLFALFGRWRLSSRACWLRTLEPEICEDERNHFRQPKKSKATKTCLVWISFSQLNNRDSTGLPQNNQSFTGYAGSVEKQKIFQWRPNARHSWSKAAKRASKNPRSFGCLVSDLIMNSKEWTPHFEKKTKT